MYHSAETAKGVVTASAGVAGVTWISYPNIWSFVCFVMTLAGALWGWYVMHLAESREQKRRDDLADAIQRIQVTNLEVVAMIARLYPKDDPENK